MEIKQLFYAHDRKKDTIKGISSEVPIGKVTTIIGPNGCGKSTLLGLMSGNFTPRAGSAILDGKAVNQYNPKELARRLAVVHQDNIAPSEMTVEKLVSFGRLPHQSMLKHDKEEDEEAIEWALTSTNLLAKRDLLLEQLSGGERQRVWLAMALAQKTSILFLDEPTTYLDIRYQFELLDLVRELNVSFGLTIVMVLHDINQAIRYSDQIMIMKEGQIYMQGTPREVVSEAMVREIFGIEVAVKEEPATGLYIVPLRVGPGNELG